MTENEAPKSLGRYQIVRELGHGAMGVVYEGLDPNIGRRVAIKTARRDVMVSSGRGDEMMERFLREARAAGALNHPNIITIYDAGEEEEGLAYIAMEFLDGPDLFKLFHEKRRFDVKDAVEVGATVCTALAHAHEHGVVHRDVKPSNIIMLNNGQIKVADFGIARVSDSNLTQEGAMIGTPHYMSPEQFMGHKVDARSDLFSVGIILYELITGEKPFAGEALSAVMHNVIKTTPVAPHELNFAANECLSKVIMKALNKDPNQRYQNGSTMAAALRESLKEAPDPAVTLVGAIAPRQPVAETIVASGGVAETVLGTGGPGETLTAGVKQNAPAVGAPSIRKASPSNESVSEKPSRRRALALAGAGVLAVAAIAVATYAMMDRSFFSDANVTLILQEATASLDDIGAVGADRLKDRPLTDYHAKLGSGTVLFSRSNGEPKQVEISDGGTARVELDSGWKEIDFEATRAGYSRQTGHLAATKANDTATLRIVLLEEEKK